MRIAFLVAVLLSVHATAADTKLYKTVDEHGNVVFSDAPPAEAQAQEAETFQKKA